MKKGLRLDGTIASIRLLGPDDAEPLAELLSVNRSFLAPYDPVRPESYWTVKGQRAHVDEAARDAEVGTAYAFCIFDGDGALAGRIGINNIVRKAWLNATVGYWVDQARNSRGLATEAVRLMLRFAFDNAGLHRVQAGVMPRNARSIRVLEKNGFRYEGLAERYLMINGVWEDHGMYAITAEEAISS